MDSLLAPHLEKIAACSRGIASLEFAPPGKFTNAILKSSNIVSLIRDSDEQERALFTVPKPAHSLEGASSSTAPRRNTAVQSVLGGEMIQQLRRGGAGGMAGGVGGAPGTNEVDVDLLLRGAEKLTNVYHIPGAKRRIAVARERFEQLTESIAVHEDLVEAQGKQLELLNQHMDDGEEEKPPVKQETEYVTNDMLEQEEEAIRLLEQKRDELESKIKSLDRQMSFVYRKNT